MRKSFWLDLVCGILILLFVYTATSKFQDLPRYQSTLRQSPLIQSFAGALAWGLPVLEIMLALLLIIPATRKTGLYASMVLLSCFTLYILYLLLFASTLPCSCGGVLSQLTWRQHLWFNLLFIGLCITGTCLQKKRRPSSSVAPAPTIHKNTL